jgi:hypothetical protein
MEDDYMNEDVRRVMSKLIMRMQETEETSPFQTDLSVVEKNQTPSHPKESLENILPVPASPSKSKIKPKDFANITLARMNGIKQKSMENLKKIAESQQVKEVAELKKVPEINAHSKKIGKRNEPVFERVEKEIKESQKNMEQIKLKLEAERDAKVLPDLTFKPKILTKNDSKRSNEEYFRYHLQWSENKKLKTEKKREELEEKLKEELKFTPEIDNNSISMIPNSLIKRPIEDRLLEKLDYIKKKREIEREEKLFSFAPVIEEKSRTMVKQKTEGDVFTRLFNLSKEQPVIKSTPKYVETRNRSFSFSNDMDEDSQRKAELLFDLS